MSRINHAVIIQWKAFSYLFVKFMWGLFFGLAVDLTEAYLHLDPAVHGRLPYPLELQSPL